MHQLIDLGRSTIEETHPLLSHFHDRMPRQAVTGFSQGGLHAAMAAAVCQWPVGVVAGFAPPSAAPVFTDGVLADVVDWEALGAENKGDILESRHRLNEALRVSHIEYFPDDTCTNKVLFFAKNGR